MGRRLAVAVLAVLVLAAPAASDPGSVKERLDARIGDLRDRITSAEAKEDVLTSDLAELTARVRSAQAAVAAEQAQLATIELRLADQRVRRQRLDRLVTELAERLEKLRREEATSVAHLEQRVREIYMADEPDPVAFVIGSASFGDLIDTIELLDRIGRQDERIVDAVRRSRERVLAASRDAREARADARAAEASIARHVVAQRLVRDRLVSSRDALAAAESTTEATIAGLREDKAEFVAEVEALEAESAALAAQIRAAQEQAAASGTSPARSSGGLAWPVSGPVTSGFGPRWGRMHEGIDIAVPTGTPVRASAPGTVIHADWLGGYGLLVVVDHGGGLSTAYAHNSSLASGVGTSVGRGDVIAYSGNTGNSSGPHVHFEVRVGGAAVDPMGYL